MLVVISGLPGTGKSAVADQVARTLAHVSEPSWSDIRSRAEAFEPWQGPHERIEASGSIAAVAASVLHRLESAEPHTS